MRPAWVILLLAPVVPLGMAGSPDHTATCGGVAPLVNDCDLGTHVFGELRFVGPDYSRCTTGLTGAELPEIDRYACFVGDVQVVVEGTSPYVKTCSFAQVYRVHIEFTCVERGALASGEASVACHARRYHSVDPDVPGSGEPAAVGEWRCLAAHDWR